MKGKEVASNGAEHMRMQIYKDAFSYTTKPVIYDEDFKLIDEKIVLDKHSDAIDWVAKRKYGRAIGNTAAIKKLTLGGGNMSRVTTEWLQSHVDEFLLFVQDQGAISLQVPVQDIWNLCDHSRPHANYEEAYQYSIENDARFYDKLKGILSRYSGNLIPFYQFERHRTLSMKIYSKQEEANEETKVSQESEKKSTSSKIKDALVDGGKRSMYSQGAEVMLDTFEALVGSETASAVLATEAGREVVKGIMSMAYLYAADNTDIIPSNDKVDEICTMLISQSSQKVIEPNMGAFRAQLPKMVKSLTQISQGFSLEKAMEFDIKIEEEVAEEEKQPATAGGHLRDRG